MHYGFALIMKWIIYHKKYVNYFVLQFANEAEIFAVYNSVYRPSEAFPNVQRVKNISLEMCYPYDRSTL